ncbi:hypothetical protein UPYG_G00236090 [Umbra pygmaea]|uniref:B30.2/SPRY domain-containing protein n=1 Tax=Umbra pygmaea TaxID=75934 RepID=A0ABD0WJD6_UMBPY
MTLLFSFTQKQVLQSQTMQQQPDIHTGWEPSRLEPVYKSSYKKDKHLETVDLTHSEPWNKPKFNKDCHQETWAHSMQWNKPHFSSSKPGLASFHTLQECLQIMTELAEEVNDKLSRKTQATNEGGQVASPSIERSRDLIQLWANELHQNASLQKISQDWRMREMKDLNEEKGRKDEDRCLENQRIMEWATELKNVSEMCGLSDEDIKCLLCPGGVKKSKLAHILPLLEFVTWSLLSVDSEENISKLWLSTKQKAWRSGKPKYIPNSVWQWIHNAFVPVHVDPLSSHPWLAFSEDNLQVWEGGQRAESMNYPHCFDKWPCVLGCQAMNTGRHYWEIALSAEGGWRLGVTSVNAPRRGRFPMTPANGYWTLWRGTQNTLWVCGDPQTKLTVRAHPHIVGIYLDFEEGQISFYDVETRVHIYTFSEMFKEPVVPVFGCLDGDTKIRIMSQPTMLSPPLLLTKMDV